MRALRRFFGQPWVLPLTALLLRARTVRPSAPFALRELVRTRSVIQYRLAGNGLRVTIRHGTADPVTLGEVFHERDYVPSDDIERRLAGPREIVDLGANIGLFGAFAAARWPGSKIVAYEPDPGNVIAHRSTIAANRLEHRWTLVAAAAGAHDGSIPFICGAASLSRLAEPGAPGAVTVPIVDVMAAVGAADLVKMDIEGGEWEILADPRFRQTPPRAIVLEYHPYLCPEPDARHAAVAALRDAGMEVRPLKRSREGHGMLWAWRL